METDGPIKSSAKFQFDGADYDYCVHPYNKASTNERTVEVPIGLAELQRAYDRGVAALEVGNVLVHYTNIPHTVVDKYESAGSPIPCDILDYRPSGRFDAIVSVSTIEHIGIDEEVRDTEKAVRALRHLVDVCLKPEGRMVVTIPVGYHPALDDWMRGPGNPVFDAVKAMRRTSTQNEWEEVPPGDTPGTRYGAPYAFANAVLVGIRGGNKP